MRWFLGLVLVVAVSVTANAQECFNGQCSLRPVAREIVTTPIRAVQATVQASRQVVSVAARPVRKLVASRPIRRLLRCR